MADYPMRNYATQDSAAPEHGLSAAITMAHERVDNLEEQVGKLTEKLSPVLLGQVPTVEAVEARGGVAADQGPHQSELHKRTAALEERIRRLNHAVGNLLDRIDL